MQSAQNHIPRSDEILREFPGREGKGDKRIKMPTPNPKNYGNQGVHYWVPQ